MLDTPSKDPLHPLDPLDPLAESSYIDSHRTDSHVRYTQYKILCGVIRLKNSFQLQAKVCVRLQGSILRVPSIFLSHDQQ